MHARHLDPPLEVVRIPFEGTQIVGYLRLPTDRSGPVPMVLAISGLDSRKETVGETFAAILPHGVGFLAVDGPGTGQAPLKVGAAAERMFSRVLDYLVVRPEVDKTRIAVFGVSFGGYWAAKLAHTERARLLGEDLTLYKDLSGTFGLVDRHCAHRRAALSGMRPDPLCRR